MMSTMLYCEIHVFALVLMGMMLLWNHKVHDHSASGLWFTRSLLAFTVNFACNFFWGLANGGVLFPKEAPYFWSYLFKVLYFISLNVAIFIWTVYSETEQNADTFKSSENVKILILPLLFAVFMTLITPWTHLVFVIRPDGSYEREMMFQVQMALILAYSGISGGRMLGKAKYEVNQQRKGQMVLIGTFPLYILAAWALSFIFPDLPIICVAVTCAMLSIYVGNSTQQISVDKLTQINNRANLLGYIGNAIKNHEMDLYILMMDVDYFKKVNDTFGHQEGDAALIRVANSLKSACSTTKKRAYLARYGGDEFIIVMEAPRRDEVDQLCRNIHEKLYYYNMWANVTYDLRVSIGVAKWEPGMDTKAFIEAADAQLYEAKKTRKPFTTHEPNVPRGVNLNDD